MKRLLLILFSLLFCGLGYGQDCPITITLYSQQDVDSFAINYPECTELNNLQIGTYEYFTDIDDLSELSQINTINGFLEILNNNNLQNLNGLQGLTSINGDITINRNHALLNFEGLENLTYIGGNFTVGKPISSLWWISGQSGNDDLTNFIGLENLTTIEGTLHIKSNDGLSNLIGLERLNSVDNIYIGANSILTSIEQPLNIDSLYSLTIDSNVNLFNISGFENLHALNNLQIVNNYKLNDITALENIDYNTINNVHIAENPKLYNCSMLNFCNYLSLGNEALVEDNKQGCNAVIEILNSCNNLTKIRNHVFYDINQNKILDNNEGYLNAVLSLEPSSNYFYTNANSESIHFINPGSYTITYDQSLNPNWQLTTDSTSYFISLEEGESEEVEFGIYPINQITDISTTIVSPPTRCNEFITFDITTKNLGTTVASGTTWFEADEYIEQIEFIDQPDTTITSFNFYGWHFNNLYPGESMTKQVSIKIPGPPDFAVGGAIYFGAFSKFVDINGEDTSEGFRYNPEVRCSFDPNDKLVSPTRHNDYTLFNEDIIYTVRFQNTGNDLAYNITIKDTLDTNLDHSSFRVLGSSHLDKLSTSMSDTGVLTFEFRDIFLPDSTANLEASQGYVTYRIRANEGLFEYTPIQNSAGIYFDQNPPVLTNTTLNVMISELPIVSTTTPNELPDFHILPNPNTGIFQVQGIHEGTYKILNTAGQLIQTGSMKNDILLDISEMPKGVYFLSITINQQNIVKRIIKI